MNTFDAAVISVVIVLALLGFRAGLLRSLADILGFVIAAPLAVALTPYLSSALSSAAPGATSSPWGQNSLVFFGLLLVGGMVFAQLLRHAIVDFAGSDIHLLDRSAGFVLGRHPRFAGRGYDCSDIRPDYSGRPRTGIPQGFEAAGLGSHWPPSAACDRCRRRLADYIDRLKRERGL
jgi:membrane protein required for colicin V production